MLKQIKWKFYEEKKRRDNINMEMIENQNSHTSRPEIFAKVIPSG
jgi:hypothetical protein